MYNYWGIIITGELFSTYIARSYFKAFLCVRLSKLWVISQYKIFSVKTEVKVSPQNDVVERLDSYGVSYGKRSGMSI